MQGPSSFPVSYPPCRRFRRPTPSAPNPGLGYPPCRRFRSYFGVHFPYMVCYPPCRRFRRLRAVLTSCPLSYPPCRRFRSMRISFRACPTGYPPCRRFRRKQDIWVCRSCSSRPFFEKFRHVATGTLAFEPIHDLGKLAAVEDDGKAPGSGVDTLPRL